MDGGSGNRVDMALLRTEFMGNKQAPVRHAMVPPPYASCYSEKEGTATTGASRDQRRTIQRGYVNTTRLSQRTALNNPRESGAQRGEGKG